ncbi:MAG TPA: S41 family peptidase [Gammaproteobacteria bacterium]|jgi:carboxyl-terminal processing protease|nr:S41 family peptidase [Gammaproteobacteria bacterium]
MLTLRSFLILSIGIVLGLGLAAGSAISTGHGKNRHAREAAQAPSAESVGLVAEVLDRVRREYVDRVDDRQLVEGAIRGIVKELDQHSSYLDPSQYEEIRISTSGNYTGVGLDVSVDDGKVTVVEPLAGAPAAEAGILPGDVVVSVDDMPVEQGNVAETVNRMRGAAGTPVTVGVVRGDSDKPLRFALTRAAVQVKTVSSEYLGNGLAYFRLTAFAESTPRDLALAAHRAIQQSGGRLLGVVLDLRNNPGGVLDAAVQVADEFLADGLIVRGTGRVKQARFEQFASAGDELEGVSVVLLVNGGSASASEIVAGALQDRKRGKLVGERTYGKGSVQTVMPLGEGGALKLTTSLYLTPSGRSINGRGIDPDVVVHNADPQRQYRGPGSRVAMADDQQLLEALRLVSYESISLSAAR